MTRSKTDTFGHRQTAEIAEERADKRAAFNERVSAGLATTKEIDSEIGDSVVRALEYMIAANHPAMTPGGEKYRSILRRVSEEFYYAAGLARYLGQKEG